MLLSILAWLAVAAAQQPDLTKLPAGCTVKTFGVTTPGGWFVTNAQDPPEGREGCIFILFADDKSPAAVMHLDSASAKLPLFEQGDPFETLFGKIAEGLAKNMNVVVTQETFRNDDLKRAPRSTVTRASMRAYDANIPGNPNAHEVAIAVLRAPGYFYTVFVVSPGPKADRELSDAAKDAFREILNSLTPVPDKR